MAIPTVTNVYPAQMHSGGKGLVRILGGGFAEDIAITFGGVTARRVMRVNHALTYTVPPISPLQDATTGAGDGSVDIGIQNLDENGDPVIGEVVTVTDGFTYQMPKFATNTTVERVFLRLREELRRQMWREIIHRRHADYSRDGSAVYVEISSLPAIALIGPQVVFNPVYHSNHKNCLQGERFIVARQAPITVDLQFGLVGAWNRDRHGFGLLESTIGFFKKNIRLEVDKVDGDSAQGQVFFDMQFTLGGLPAIVSAPNESDVSAFSGTGAIVGVILEGLSSLDELPESDFFHELVGGPPVIDIDTYQLP
jgi:hypothetical protein